MAKAKPAAAPTREIDAATLELRQETLRKYWAATHAANDATTAAWKAPTPESAWVMLQGLIAQNDAYKAYAAASGKAFMAVG